MAKVTGEGIANGGSYKARPASASGLYWLHHTPGDDTPSDDWDVRIEPGLAKATAEHFYTICETFNQCVDVSLRHALGYQMFKKEKKRLAAEAAAARKAAGSASS